MGTASTATWNRNLATLRLLEARLAQWRTDYPHPMAVDTLRPLLTKEVGLLVRLVPGGTNGGELDLMNINAVMHPAQMVGNASWIEATHGEFRIYQEGTGPALARVMDAVDPERIAIADRLGVPTTPFVESLHQSGYTTAEAARTGQAYPALQAGDAIRNVTAPPTLDHRYLHEDVGWGLVPWMELADAIDVPTPTMAALTCLASVMNDTDYRTVGLTLTKMGLHGTQPDLIPSYVRTGESPA